MPLREYVDSLNGVAKSRYFDKLKVLGLAATDDPYTSGDFQNAMRLWLPVKFNGRRSKRTTVEVIYMLLHSSFPPVGVVSARKGVKNSFTRFCGIYLYIK